MDRFLNKENANFSIITNREFKPANDVLTAHLVKLAREGKISSTKHKPALIPQDVKIFYQKKQLGLETPESLIETAWFNIMLHSGKHGRENMRKMSAEDIQIHKSSSGLEYITLVERATKNHQGGVNSSENEAAAVMSEMPEKQSLVSCLGCEDLLVEAKQAMSSSLAKTKKLQSDEIQPCRRCLVLQLTTRKTQVNVCV